MSSQDKQIKKKPGRPKKIKSDSKIPINGKVDNPTYDDYLLEIVYDNPFIIKNIFSLFESYKVHTIIFTFKKDSFYIDAEDHSAVNNIHLTFDINKLNNYYCSDTFILEINAKEIYDVMNIIKKSYSQVHITIEKEIEKLIFTFKEIIVNSQIQHDFSYKRKNIETNLGVSFSFNNYPLKIGFPGKYFKDLLSDVKKLATILEFNWLDDKKLLFLNCASSVSTKFLYSDNKSIIVEYTGKDNLYCSSCKIGYLKALENSVITDCIFVYVHAKENIIFQMVGDVFDLRVNTQIN